jgi:hypothetical protein
MAKSLQRKKPGYTKAGNVKIVSLSYKQLFEMVTKVGKKKLESKIRRRMNMIERRKGFVNPIAVSAEAVVE